MSQNWYRLFVPKTDSQNVIAALRSPLEAEGYTPFDPFPGGTGTPPGLTTMVRLFVAPPQDGWVCVLGEYPEDRLPDFNKQAGAPVLAGWLTDEGGGFALYRGGTRHDDPATFGPYLRPGQPPDTLSRAFAGAIEVEMLENNQPPIAVLGADALPPELQQFAQDQGADPVKASKMFEKMSGNLLKRFGGQSGASREEQEQAHAMFMGGGQDIWNSLHGQRVRAIAGVLNLPANWRVPSLQTVRDAYQVHRLRKRAPRLALMPGDKETMDAVPDALDYTPVYLGRP
jgi:hypothetical protein